MISDLILCHKVRKLFVIIITQKEEIRSQIYRKTRFILSIEKQIFLTNCSRIFLSRIESLLLANIHIRFRTKNIYLRCCSHYSYGRAVTTNNILLPTPLTELRSRTISKRNRPPCLTETFSQYLTIK